MSSDLINISGTPILPDVSYYDSNDNGPSTDKTNDVNFTSYSQLTTNLTNSCINDTTGNPINNSSGIYSPTDTNITQYLPDGQNTKSLDIPFYLAKSGILINNTDNTSENLSSVVANNCSNNQQNLVNQIQYLTCQVENCRNMTYDSSSFSLSGQPSTVKTIFEKMPSLKIPLIIIFIISMYFGVSGLFGSMDVVGNIFNAIDKKITFTASYWAGLLIGLTIPIVILCASYASIVCSNLTDLEQYEITNNAYGIQSTISGSVKRFDYLILSLFIFLIYAFVGVLFTIKKTFFSPLIYTGLIATILFIIATFIYILYNYIPFFDTGDSSNMMNPSARPLRLFVNEQGDPEPITSNQTEDIKVKKSFLVTLVIIFILAVIFFILKSSNSFINGFLGSSAILIIPILWVFNFYFVINYFYIYPIILIIIRFIRSFLMTGLYIMLEKKPELKDNISDELLNQLDNFKNYSPTWGLIGIDELKLLLNVFGYDNIFSKGIIAENNNSKNISNNKFISSGLFKFISNFMVTKDQSNMKGIILSIINLVVTILISCIILFGIVKVQNI